MKKVLPFVFLAVLLAPLLCPAQDRQPPPRISFDFMDADIRNVLRVIAEVSKKNMVIADDVKGKVTVKLDNVSCDEAMDVILRNNDLAKVEEDNMVRIMTARKLREEQQRDTKERVEYLKEKEARRKLEEKLVTRTIYLNYADLGDVMRMIKGESPAGENQPVMAPPAGAPVPALAVERPKGLLSPEGVVTAVKFDNALIVRDTKDSVDNIEGLIKKLDTPPKQVQIEARIVQANSNFSKELGIQWGASYRTRIGGQTIGTQGGRQVSGDSSATTFTAPTGNLGIRDGTVSFPYNVNLPATMGPGLGGSMGIFVGGLNDSLQLDVVLSALEAQGQGKVISNPKVVTSENHEARISQGTEIPYQSSSAQLGTNILFKLAVLELDVTPYVLKDGNIRLRIKAKKDEPNFDTRFPVPAVTKREAVTELLVKNGETVVLGGIYEMTRQNNTSGIPILQHIPLLGWLFKHNAKVDNKVELLIFVTPTVLRDIYAKGGEQ